MIPFLETMWFIVFPSVPLWKMAHKSPGETSRAYQEDIFLAFQGKACDPFEM